MKTPAKIVISIIIFSVAMIGMTIVCTARTFSDSDIIGTWTAASNLGVERVTYAGNFTFTSVFTGVVNAKETGTWKLEDTEIVIIPKSNPLSPESVGKKQREKIIKLNRHKIITVVPGYETTYKRSR